MTDFNREMPRITRLKENKKAIRSIAAKHNWQETDEINDGVMMTFVRDDKKIEVWPSRMTVATMLKHPKQGKTKLYRRNVWELKVLEAIFKNPRVHTTGGYKKKKGRKSPFNTELDKGKK